MTKEQLKKANEYMHIIEQIQARIALLDDMDQCESILIKVGSVGVVPVSGVTKDAVISLVREDELATLARWEKDLGAL